MLAWLKWMHGMMEKLQKWIPGIISPVMSAWACAVVSQPRRLHTGRPYAFASAKNVDFSTAYALQGAYMAHLDVCMHRRFNWAGSVRHCLRQRTSYDGDSVKSTATEELNSSC